MLRDFQILLLIFFRITFFARMVNINTAGVQRP